jgi:hypothetical protein
MEFLYWIEELNISIWVRESPSLWAYPFILSLHTVGLGILVGISIAVDLRLLGFGGGIPIAPLERFFPLMWFGFWINAISGVLLLMADASTKTVNPVFWVKLILIGLAVWNVTIIRKKVFRSGQAQGTTLPPNAKLLALTSLFLWIGATTAGRLMAYIGPEVY